MPLLSTPPVKRQTLAEQMAETIKELILSNQLTAGVALPTEPELAEQFGVSRAVVRDATRILMAWGLVEVQHGRGVFVTESQTEAFGEALLLALRRRGATVWDVEQFEQVIFPEVVALAAQMATEAEVAHIRQVAEAYLAAFRAYQETWWPQDDVPDAALEELRRAYEVVWQAIFDATHNQVFQQLAHPLRRLRNLRSWSDEPDATVDSLVAQEAGFVNRVINALAGRDAAQARAIVAELMVLPPEAIDAMRRTPVGDIPRIPPGSH